MNISVPNPEKNYKVLVRCITYNHSKFICDALNGFSIQETDFPFICIVVDDASKDGTQDVIKQYANDNCDMSKSEISEDDISVYIRVPHKINTNCVFLFCLLKLNLYGKPEKQEIYKPYRVVCEYEALCEGDDYWIDLLKLQKQVDFLEANENCGLVFTNYKYLWEKHSSYSRSEFSKQFENIKNRGLNIYPNCLFWGDFIKTCTVCVRISIYTKAREIDDFLFSGYFPMGDTNTWFAVGYLSDIGIINEVTSIYRKCSSSVTLQKDKKKAREFSVRGAELRMYFLRKYDADFHVFFKKKIIERYEHAVLVATLYDIPVLKFGKLSLKPKLLSQIIAMPYMRKTIIKILQIKEWLCSKVY